MSNNSGLYTLIALIGFLCLMIGVIIGFGVGTFKQDSCIRNPLYYGISQFENEDLHVYCSCYFDNPEYASFFFNETGIFPYHS